MSTLIKCIHCGEESKFDGMDECPYCHMGLESTYNPEVEGNERLH